MWELNNIPKILHLYWGRNKHLSWMRFMTALSFVKNNPDWKVYVWYEKRPCKNETWLSDEQKSNQYNGKDWFPELKNLDNTIVKPFDFEEYGFSRETPEVFKSYIIRLNLLYRYGGFWSDFDIFYFKPMTELSINKEKNNNVKFFCCQHYHEHYIGFLASQKNSLTIKYLYSMIEECYDKRGYQSIGSLLFKKALRFYHAGMTPLKGLVKGLEENILNISFNSVYPVQWYDTPRLYDEEDLSLLGNTIGIHWFAGSKESAIYENLINGESVTNIKWLNDMIGRYNEI